MHKQRLIIDKRSGRPGLEWSPELWSTYFSSLKKTLPASPTAPSAYFLCPAMQLKSGEVYLGETAYQSYCNYINSVLSAIRRGEHDYCYFIYQISDLLLLEPALQARLCCEDRLCPYFEVWLDLSPQEDTI